MTIGKLAAAAGVPTSTVRFYERAGLLPRAQRSPGSYREYSLEAVERLRLIRSAQAVGLSVKDITALLKLSGSDTSPCRDIEQLMQKRLSEVRRRMKDLKRVERSLTKAMATCCKTDEPSLCEKIAKSCPCENSRERP